MGTVFIISDSLDVHSDIVEQEFRQRGVDSLRLNTDCFTKDRVELTFEGSDQGKISLGEDQRLFSQIISVWYRRPGCPEVGVSNPHQKQFAEAEAGEFLRQLYFSLNHALWVSKYSALEAARRKLPQIRIAQKCGLAVPRTLVTNSPKEVRAFFTECGGKIAYKVLHAPVIKPTEGPELWGVPTSLLGESHMEKIDLIRHTGGIFQEYVEKQYEVRVTIIGRELFAAKIDSQAEESSRIDWREAVALGKVEVTPYDLLPEVANLCKEIVRAYGLAFGAIDLIRTPEGKYVFLEINCNGQWLWVEEFTKQPLLDSMVRFLTLQQ